FGGNTCTLEEVGTKKIAVAIFSADPVRPHNVDVRIKAAANIQTLIRLGLTPVGLYERAALSLPTCSWAEKSGVFENIDGVIQAFAQAIPPMEDARAIGRIFWDLLGMSGRYNSQAVRTAMVTAGLPEYANIAEPASTVKVEEMEFA